MSKILQQTLIFPKILKKLGSFFYSEGPFWCITADKLKCRGLWSKKKNAYLLCSVDSALDTACCSMWADWVFSWSVGIQKRIIFCQSLFVSEMLSKCRVNVQIALKFSSLSIFFYNSRDFLKFFLVSKIPPKIPELCS